MKKELPAKVALGIRKVVAEKGKGIQVQLVSGCVVWLPKKKTSIKTDEQGLLAEIPGWLKKKIDIELRNSRTSH